MYAYCTIRHFTRHRCQWLHSRRLEVSGFFKKKKDQYLYHRPLYNFRLRCLTSQPTTPHPIPLPYSYKVPRTDTILRLGLGSPVPVRKILSLLMVCEHSIAGSIATQTRDGEIDWQTPQRQNFEYDLGDGIRIHVLNLSGHVVKWGQLQIVIRGLIQFLVDGNRGYEAMFRFRSDGQGEVGWGYIAKGGNRPNMLQDH